MNGRKGFKAINTKVIVLPKRDLNHKLKLVSNEDWEKRLEFFWVSRCELRQYSCYNLLKRTHESGLFFMTLSPFVSKRKQMFTLLFCKGYNAKCDLAKCLPSTSAPCCVPLRLDTFLLPLQKCCVLFL